MFAELVVFIDASPSWAEPALPPAGGQAFDAVGLMRPSCLIAAVVIVRLFFVKPYSDRTCSIPRMRIGLRCPRSEAPVRVVRCMAGVLNEVGGRGAVQGMGRGAVSRTVGKGRGGVTSSIDEGEVDEDVFDCWVAFGAPGIWA